MAPKQTFTECVLCSKPLGQESKENGLMLCHNCRACGVCKHPLSAREVLEAWDEVQSYDVTDERFKDLTLKDVLKSHILHTRCFIASTPNGEQDPSVLVKQSYIDFLNQFRFLPDPELSPETNAKMAGLQAETYVHKLSFDSRYTYLCMLEAAVAHVSIAIKTDKKVMKQAADLRESKKFEKAAAQARVSSRTANKPETDEKEIILGAFMEANGLTERTTAIKLLRDRSKAIQGLMDLGITKEMAIENVDKSMRERGQIK